MKKALAFIMSLVLLLTAVLPIASVWAVDECSCDYTPIVYIKGRTNIYKDRSNLDAGLAERNLSGGDDSIKEAALNICEALARAMFLNDWDNYCDVLYNEIAPVYDSYALDESGNIANASGISPFWDTSSIIERIYARGRDFHITAKDDIELYQFQYDCRLDPCDTAADLNDVIKAVIAVTGHSKVKIVARCQGTVIANAYFNMYGWDDIDEVLLYNSIASGAEIADTVFSGDVPFTDTSAWNRFLYEYLDTSPVLDFIKAVVDVSEKNGLLDATTGMVQLIYNKIAPNLMPRIIKATFGQCPGWYGMVSADKIDDCVGFVLGDNDDGKFDPLIEKIYNYNDNYKVHARSVLEEMQADGVNVYIITKYNDQMYPVVTDADMLGDNVVSVYKQTYMGATCADITKELSEEYIAGADSKYISPDKMIDSSTGLFPDHTWYIRDLRHDRYPSEFDSQLFKILRYDGYTTIDTYEDIPQWLLFEDGKKVVPNKIFPLTTENTPQEGVWPSRSFFKSSYNFIQQLFAFLKYLIEQRQAA